ncbi:FecR protein [Rubripirellula tenax]|uniref:FecR protein n=1 Tax=Rubripirellula tenax TaxID=2528015 RepID=A0A5C6FHY0_9BACT|nr:FecR domain-containing protein [Rubripirellula tenax]TWU59241.1 FecR protein [Rubripirellula tenax]
MDNDLKTLLAAWLSSEWDDSELEPALKRLRTDESLRKSLADELAILSQARAVQSSEPKWLKLEDALSVEEQTDARGEDFESRVMAGLAEENQSGLTSSMRKLFSPAFVLAAAVVVALVFSRFDFANLGAPGDQAVAIQDADTAVKIELVAGLGKSPVAVLSQSVNAQWGGDHRPVPGDNLEAGDLILEHGTIQIEFLAGVRLLLQAPADIQIRAADEVLIRHGSASCFVTEMGRGFRVLTKEMEVIDLGTAFSIDVKRDGQPEVHVLDGSVEIKSPQGETLELKEMHAIRMGNDGPEDVEYSPDRFPKTSDLRGRQHKIAQLRYESWKANAVVLGADPSVMLHYTFEETDPSALELGNVAKDPTRATNGVVIGCQWDRGRWPSKRALVYRNAGDRVLFQVPGAVDAVTFLVWARVDAMTQDTTSLLMTEHPVRRAMFLATDNQSLGMAMQRRRESTVETVRWELSQYTHNVMFSVGHGMQRSEYDELAVDHPYTRSDRWGNWACMGVTCDVNKREVTHYLNGDPIGTGHFERAVPLLLDFMELGNFGTTTEELEHTSGAAQRRFYGAIDEVLIADRVFEAAEIKAFWEAGIP